jgi:hypothetical protein
MHAREEETEQKSLLNENKMHSQASQEISIYLAFLGKIF